jgi:hypothetical protein
VGEKREKEAGPSMNLADVTPALRGLVESAATQEMPWRLMEIASYAWITRAL